MAQKPLLGQGSENVEFLWFNISHLNKTTQFFLCTAAVFVFYLIYGYLQEYMFASGFKPYGWYLTLLQFGCYSILGFIELKCRRIERIIPLTMYSILAALSVGTIGFSNFSLKYLNYPTQVIFKSCKLIPVMIGGILIQKKQYRLIDYMASGLMCLGLIAFTLADSQVSPDFNILGVMVISCALACDAVIGNFQEKIIKKHNATNCEMIFFSYFIGFLYLAVILTATGDVFSGFSYCYQYPSIYVSAILFSVAGYLGIGIILTLVRTCGALTAVTVTTFRKAVSIVISFIFFQKPFTLNYLWASLLIIAGIYINIFAKTSIKMPSLLSMLRRRRVKEKDLPDIV
ncbi:adenosine 3'-phospho 5'-phosphosulfate transporter 2 [Planococcus citri]|uniref:adenosine 3'-phospho 5'-phosphosulfate transporter 2 n=1 Tax=Planococcus citri TaxID=170843 RepID=UPI0031F94230